MQLLKIYTILTYFQGAVTLQISRNENYTMFMFTAKTFFFNHKLEKKSSLIFLSFARFYINFLDKTKMVLRKILIVATI